MNFLTLRVWCTVSIYMVPRRDRPLQTWKTFLRNHVEGIASIDLFVVPTIAFQQLFAFLVLGHRRRQLLWFAVTRNPTLAMWSGTMTLVQGGRPVCASVALYAGRRQGRIEL